MRQGTYIQILPMPLLGVQRVNFYGNICNVNATQQQKEQTTATGNRLDVTLRNE